MKILEVINHNYHNREGQGYAPDKGNSKQAGKLSKKLLGAFEILFIPNSPLEVIEDIIIKK